MKKVLLLGAMVFAGAFAFAQKPGAGDKTAEVSFTGAGLNSFNYTAPELRYRYFMADNMAIRARLGLGSSSQTVKETQNVGGADINLEAKIGNGFNLNLSPGIEMHFAGTEKLSPYAGAQLNLNISGPATLEVTNATGYSAGGGFTGAGNNNKLSQKTGSGFGFGLGLLMGADYYIADAVFVGGEFGLNLFSINSVGEGESTTTVNGTAGPTVKTGTSSSTDLFGVTTGGVRLGFKF